MTFGPTNERVFGVKMNRQAKRAALAMSLTDKVRGEKFVAVDSLRLPEAKTRNAAAFLGKLPVFGKKTLIIVEPENRGLPRAVRNLPHVTAISARSLNIVDVLRHEFVLASSEAVNTLVQLYAKQAKS